ncbi:fucose-1-phosphate guanylyltransferase-like isoform X1 [Homarus americanus]|uniref:fucose-1-phosphate guanylyltransferase-like isoform X1 n=2 Tax=Homarus americanus TaxID=6706 RepID=UPI001C46A2D1|nr:fucose-1-phosphate guanylyltransferase-like isoform X1 [Homarus americanus]
MDNERSKRIRDFMQDLFRRYNCLRVHTPEAKTENKFCGVEKSPFWDVVVLTTFDAAQRESFQRQIDFKKKHGQLPEVSIRVVADPPNQKLGVGGSTLHVLMELHKEFGDELYQRKVLIIHSGGSSQRLPSYSVLGKIFAPVPAKGLSMNCSVPQMFDLKLAMYLPFCELLGPGVFVTCADDIETYCLHINSLDMKSLESADVVALGHPSSLSTGKGHGVYVIGNYVTQSSTCTSSVQECMEVLQKPSESVMRSRGAVFVKEEGDISKEQVWSDSVFWLSSRVCRDLLEWYRKNSPLSSELDAYAHFLPCLGTRMVDAKPSDFKDFRFEMLPILKDFSLKVLLLEESEFYHMGTMEEYLMHFNIMRNFCEELAIVKNTSNSHDCCIVKVRENLPSSFENGMIIETYFSGPTPTITVPQDSTQFVIENCHINLSFKVDSDIIMSNCVIQECSNVSFLNNELNLFGNLLYHTVPIVFKGESIYVTVAFDLTANMKSVSKDLSNIYNYGCSISDVSRILGYDVREMVPSSSSTVSLWTARMFLGGSTAAESFWFTHHAINKIKHEQDGEALQTSIDGGKSSHLFSMSDVVMLKDLETLLKDRYHLSSCI